MGQLTLVVPLNAWHQIAALMVRISVDIRMGFYPFRSHSPASSGGVSTNKEWLILLTNVPTQQLTGQEARVLMRLHWQIELIWKRWKQEGQLDTWRSEKPARILCELFAKLMGLLIQHWLTIVGCWQDPHRSQVKAARLVQKVAPALLMTLQEPSSLQGLLQRCCQAMHGCRLNPRRKHPNTSQRLLALSG